MACPSIRFPERSHPALCDLQQRVPHEKQIVRPSEEQRPRLRNPKRCSQLREQKQKRQEEEQITRKKTF